MKNVASFLSMPRKQTEARMPIEVPSGHHEQLSKQFVDLLTDEWTERLASAPVYKKSALVHIRPATPGEIVITTLADGSKETENVAGEDQVVVTNPGGEKQIVGFEKAVQRYDPADTPGLFLAKGMVRAVDNPYGCPISICAPWGSSQHGDSRCKIVALYDPSKPDVIDTDRYIIGEGEFTKTYAEASLGLKADSDTPLVASDLVLQALEEYEREAQQPSLEATRDMGMKGLLLVNVAPLSPAV